jgi:hypothetical protein
MSDLTEPGTIAFTDAALYDIGLFYLLCLEPEHDPSRFKMDLPATSTSVCANTDVLLLTRKQSRHGRAVNFGKRP